VYNNSHVGSIGHDSANDGTAQHNDLQLTDPGVAAHHAVLYECGHKVLVGSDA
jgi:pSer/pThr/pTyr-binding forkhead associated (FHA) protein